MTCYLYTACIYAQGAWMSCGCRMRQPQRTAKVLCFVWQGELDGVVDGAWGLSLRQSTCMCTVLMTMRVALFLCEYLNEAVRCTAVDTKQPNFLKSTSYGLSLAKHPFSCLLN